MVNSFDKHKIVFDTERSPHRESVRYIFMQFPDNIFADCDIVVFILDTTGVKIFF